MLACSKFDDLRYRKQTTLYTIHMPKRKSARIMPLLWGQIDANPVLDKTSHSCWHAPESVLAAHAYKWVCIPRKFPPNLWQIFLL